MSNRILIQCDLCGNGTELKVSAPLNSYEYEQELRQLGWWSRPDFPEICPRHPQPVTTLGVT